MFLEYIVCIVGKRQILSLSNRLLKTIFDLTRRSVSINVIKYLSVCNLLPISNRYS